MVDAHQRARLALLSIVKLQRCDRGRRIKATGARLSPKGAQGAVGGQYQCIDHLLSLNKRWVSAEKSNLPALGSGSMNLQIFTNLFLK
jgi:hypothetical protein